MKNRKLIRMIAVAVTTTVLVTSVTPQGTVLGAQNDPVTEETAETTESVQASEENNAEIAFMLGNVTMGSLTTPSDVHAVYFDNICIEEMDDQDEQTRIPEVESAGSVKLTQDAVLNLTGVRDAWSAAEKTVYVNGTAMEKENCKFDNDKITITGSTFRQTGNYEVVIKADGFTDTNLAFLQITSAGIEEYITNGNFAEDGRNWKFWAGGEPASASIRL